MKVKYIARRQWLFNFVLCAFTVSVFVQLLFGCKKLVDIEPPTTGVTGANVFETDATATAVLTGIYTSISSGGVGDAGLQSLSLLPGLTGDELSLYKGTLSSVYNVYYLNALSSTNTSGVDFWNKVYPVIFVANSAIEGLSNAGGLTPAVKKQLIGEAKFIRAFCYFYLVNLYGDVPLVTKIDYTINGVLPRASAEEVWRLIIDDLNEAKELLSTGYLDPSLLNPTEQRVRPTKWAAIAMLARAHLYSKKWVEAEAEATSVIDESVSFGLESLGNVFLANNHEAIWQLQPVLAGQNTADAKLFILPPSGPDIQTFPVYINPSLISSFEAEDQRKVNWTNSVIAGSAIYYYPFKYKISTGTSSLTEYNTVLRLAEQYLIRAEARAQQGNLSGAVSDLNIIRIRAGLQEYSGTIELSALLKAILHERLVELFTEWGHRWLDLKRTNSIDTVMNVIDQQKGGNWSEHKQWYPIPLKELQANPNIHQNHGY